MVTKNVFVVLTEYQFLHAVNLSTGIYNSKHFDNVIYIIRSGRRLREISESTISEIKNLQV